MRPRPLAREGKIGGDWQERYDQPSWLHGHKNSVFREPVDTSEVRDGL